MEIKTFFKERLFPFLFKDKEGNAYTKRQRKIRTTSYITKVAILSAMAYVLYTFARFPIFPIAPFNVLELDFSAVPALLGGFSLGPVAAAIIEAFKVGIKIATQGSQSSYVGDLSNLICSLAYVVPASAFYKYVKKTWKNAIVGTVIGIFANAVLSSLSNYFVIIPFYATFSPAIMEVRSLFAFGYGLAFNLISTISNGAIVFILYKRLSKVLHLGVNPTAEKKNKREMKEIKNGITISESPEETTSLARVFGSKLTGGEVILLSGDLGAGKTTFTKGLAESLGVVETVQSPTFTIIREYQGSSLKLYHIDMYRLEDESELYELGLDDCFASDAITVIEWNKLESIPSPKIIKMNIERAGDEKRYITVEGL